MKNDCSIVQELLPLYKEDMVSKDTADFVRQHLDQCDECRAEFERLAVPVVQHAQIDSGPLKTIKKQIRRNKINTILLISSLLLAFLISFFSYLTAPNYFPYSEKLLSISELGSGSINIAFSKEVTGYRLSEEVAPDDERRIIHVEAWSTIWETIFFQHGAQNAIINKEDSRPLAIYFTQNHAGGTDDAEDYLIYGTPRSTHGDTVTLPGLSLGWGLIVAGVVLVISIVLLIIMRIKGCLRLWNVRLVLLPIAYVIGHICVMHFSIVAYSVARNFSLIILVATILYCAMLLALSIYSTRRDIGLATKGL